MNFDGLDESALARLTGAPRVVARDRLSSTLDLAHTLAADGTPSGTLVLADEQTAGRGRAGRTWHSPPGAGLWLTMVLRPAEAPLGGALAVRAGLAVREALSLAAPAAAVRLKWPNDLLTGGRKLGGVLCEARWSGGRLGWVAVGVGLNVRGPLPQAVQGAAAALAETDPLASRLGVLAPLAPRLAALAARPGALTETERAGFLAALWMPPSAETVVGLEADGALLVRRPDGLVERRTDAA